MARIFFFLKQEYKCQKDYRKEAHEPTCIIQNEKSTYIYIHITRMIITGTHLSNK